jgi:hypothetical protein
MSDNREEKLVSTSTETTEDELWNLVAKVGKAGLLRPARSTYLDQVRNFVWKALEFVAIPDDGHLQAALGACPPIAEAAAAGDIKPSKRDWTPDRAKKAFLSDKARDAFLKSLLDATIEQRAREDTSATVAKANGQVRNDDPNPPSDAGKVSDEPAQSDAGCGRDEPGASAPPPSASETEDRLRYLFVAFCSALLRGKVPPERIAEIAREYIREVEQPSSVSWGSALPMSACAAKRVGNLQTPVRIFGYLAELRDPQIVEVPDDNGGWSRVNSTRARIVDVHGDSMWSLDVVGDHLIEKLQLLRQRAVPTEFLGIPVAMPMNLDARRADRTAGGARFDYVLHLVDLRRAGNAFDLLGASMKERAWAHDQLIKIHTEGSSPRRYLQDHLARGLGIVGLAEFTLLGDIIEFTVLQAVSCGRINVAPARLHGLIVGPPAQGKKLASLCARALNPVCSELSPAKATPAGLVGYSRQIDGSWRSEPGLIPQASGGVATLEDANFWDRQQLKRLGGVLHEIMEDGRVRDSVAGAASTREAETALLIDLNRTSQVYSFGGGQAEAALLGQRPVLSRLDVIFEIPDDSDRAAQVARQMYATTARDQGSLDDQPWVREVRLVVAALREEFPKIDLVPVIPLLQQEHDRVISEGLLGDDVGSFITRLSITSRRLVTASARASGRSVATAEDVECAKRFVGYKLRFLQENRVRLSGCPVPAIKEWLSKFAGQEVQPSDLADKYEEDTGLNVDERTMRRHVQHAGATKRGKARYLLPGVDGKPVKRTTGQ